MNMAAKVWISRVKSDGTLGDKTGLRWKLFGGDWSPATHIRGVPEDAYLELVQKNGRGFALDRAAFPEALAVWDRKRFRRLGDFFWANGFVVVRGRLAETLHRFDLGEGGLLPLRIFQEDLTTPEPGEFFFVNFGARKDSLVAEQSKALNMLYVDRATGRQVWSVLFGVTDGDIALTSAAREGADVWNEERIHSMIFMSEALVTAIRDAGVKIDFRLSECRIVEPN
jgi:hypothetical protein